jgi:tRNA threonylcarbamoyladenosine biosynthesis protein TsaE
MLTFISKSEEATLALGQAVAKILPGGTVIALVGDLGCGKTVFSRGLARGLGITEKVTSPTFTVAQEYRVPSDAQKCLYHLDMYRINDENAALAFGIDEFLFQPHAITLVEWPERIAGLLDDARMRRLHFEHIDENARRIVFDDSWSGEIKELETVVTSLN